jgi:hypothetical protein
VAIATPASAAPCDNPVTQECVNCINGQAANVAICGLKTGPQQYAPGCDQGSPTERAICSDKRMAGEG